MNQEVDLSSFLLLDDCDLMDLGITIPEHRERILMTIKGECSSFFHLTEVCMSVLDGCAVV